MSTGTVPPTAPPAGRRQPNQQNNRSASQFVPKIPGIETLGTSTEQRGHDFAKFIKSIHHHVLTTFRHSKDISRAILDFKDPLVDLRMNILSLSQIKTKISTLHLLRRLNPNPTHTSEKWRMQTAETKSNCSMGSNSNPLQSARKIYLKI